MSKCFRNCTILLSIFITLITVSDYNNVVGLSRGGSRGGGGYRSGSGGYRSGSGGYRSGSGAYRSGSVRTSYKVKVKIDTKPRYGGGYRSVSYTKIGYSPRYNLWSSRHGFSPSFRYRTSSYSYKSRGISMGLIFMSSRHRSTFIVYRESSYDHISICYNEFPLYDRNISVSPWFVCPWDDPNERQCCGNEIEERCCAYSYSSGSVAGVVVGILLFMGIIISIIVCYCCCCRQNKHRTEMNMVIVDAGTLNKQEQATLMPPGQVQYNPSPPFAEYPQYPQQESPMINDYYNQPQPQVDNAPYPPANTYVPGSAPYPVNPPYPTACDLNQQNPLIPPTNPPPSYSDVVKN